MQGKIVKGIGGFYYVKAENSKIYECKARGVFRKYGIKPAIGDTVEIDCQKCNIEKIYPRINELIRPPVANIDMLVTVLAAKSPNPDMFFTDKLLITCEMKNIEPVICINKTDLKSADEICEAYRNTGYKIFEISAADNVGIDKIYDYIKGKTTAFAGLSGVGKSSLLSYFVDKSIETGSISDKIERGKHTTRHVELFELADGGYVLDTPGFSSFEVDYIKPNNLENYFPEMSGFSRNCRFKGCSHIGEPDCAVKAAVFSGDISMSRYESYKRIFEALKQKNEWEL